MQVGEQIPQLLLTYGIAKGGHHAMSVQNDKGDALVVGGKAAGQVFLLEQRLQPRPVQRARVVGAMAAGAVVYENLVPVHLLRSQLAQRLGRRQRRTASGEQEQ